MFCVYWEEHWSTSTEGYLWGIVLTREYDALHDTPANNRSDELCMPEAI